MSTFTPLNLPSPIDPLGLDSPNSAQAGCANSASTAASVTTRSASARTFSVSSLLDDSPPLSSSPLTSTRDLTVNVEPNYVVRERYEQNTLPDFLDAHLQPIGELISGVGIVRRLIMAYAEVCKASAQSHVDWSYARNTNNTALEVRLPPTRNTQTYYTALLGQALGKAATLDNLCTRCANSSASCVFRSCRVTAIVSPHFPDGEVLALGSCMCCVFSGVATTCSFRSDRPDWALLSLRSNCPAFNWRRDTIIESLSDAPQTGTPFSSPTQLDHSDPFIPNPPEPHARSASHVSVTPDPKPTQVQEESLQRVGNLPLSFAYSSPLNDALLGASLEKKAVVLSRIRQVRLLSERNAREALRDEHLLSVSLNDMLISSIPGNSAPSAGWSTFGRNGGMDLD